MKMTMNNRVTVGALLFGAAGAIALSISTVGIKAPGLVRQANAAAEPRVIEIKAKKFAFSPSDITLKKGEPVILRLSTEDRTHGFLLKPLKIDTDITPAKVTDIAVTPTASGQYLVICDHYCGTGHGNMHMKVTVVE
jgi:cytochrome c oxidase subunit II